MLQLDSTSIPQLYREHAGLPSIDAYLRDWRKAHELLGRRIEALQALRDERQGQLDRGEWPRPRPEPPEDITAHELARSVMHRWLTDG